MTPMMNIVRELGELPVLFVLTFLVVAADQLSKFIARTYFGYILNTGTFFGFFQGANLFLAFLTLFIVIVVLVFFCFSRNTCARYPLAFSLVLGGGIGNAIDRFSFGGVIDFISLPLFHANLADLALTLGIILLIIASFKNEKSKKKHMKKNKMKKKKQRVVV